MALTPADTLAAVEQEAVVEIHFGARCSGQGSFFPWDTELYADPAEAPGFDTRPMVAWGPDQPITHLGFGPSALETGRYAFVLIAADGRTRLWQGFYGVDLAERRYVLRASLDCSSVPYTAILPPNASMSGPNHPFVVIGSMLLAASLISAIAPRVRLRGAVQTTASVH